MSSQIFVSGPFWEWEKKHFHCIIGASRQCQWSYLGPIKYLLKAYPSDHLKAPSIALHHMQWSVTFWVWPKWPDRTFQALLKLLHNNSGRAWKGGNILGHRTGNNCQKNIYRCDVRTPPPSRPYRKYAKLCLASFSDQTYLKIQYILVELLVKIANNPLYSYHFAMGAFRWFW